MLASSLRACFHFNHYLVLVVLLLVVYSNDDDGDQRPDRAEQRAGGGNGWTNGQCSQQPTNKGQRSTTTSIKQTTNTNTKRMKNAKAKAAQKKQGFIIITFTWQYRRIQSVSTHHGVMVTHTGSATTAANANANKHTKNSGLMLNGSL